MATGRYLRLSALTRVPAPTSSTQSTGTLAVIAPVSEGQGFCVLTKGFMVKPVYALVGDDSFLQLQELARIATALAKDDRPMDER